MTINICVLASGRGSNFLAIADSIKRGECDAKILCLISDKEDAKAVASAKKLGIATHVILADNYPSAQDFDLAIMSILDKYSPDLVVLAGYMRIIRAKELLQKYHIINIHPSLLPKYPGAHAQKDAFDAGEKLSGLTIHLVDESLDGGPILYQQEVDISECKTAGEVADKILSFEHRAYSLVIDKIAKGDIDLSKY